VLVWIYGGGWRAGASKDPSYDGARLAASGVVVVTLNYRVGFEGFGRLPGVPTNRGLLDQIAALEWVRDSIAAFGGDPGNVTVFGESAGAGNVAALLGAAPARGLFRRAIAQSVADGFLPPEEATGNTALIADAAGVAPTLDGMESLTPEQVVGAQDAPLAGRPFAVTAFGPVIDGDLVTGEPWDVVRAGAGVDLICGFMHEESRLPAGLEPSRADFVDAVAGWDLSPSTVDAYEAAYPGRPVLDLFNEFLSDGLFRMPSALVAEAHADAGGRTWVYDFVWRSPDYGACHALDVPFTFGTLDTPWARALIGSASPADVETLSGHIRAAWTSFARTGDPGWRRYGPPDRWARTWDVTPGEVADPIGPNRRIWAANRIR
jgi:para-nitrobenzyl esterase